MLTHLRVSLMYSAQCVSVDVLMREFLVPPFHVQQHVCMSQLRASLSLIHPYLPVQQHNKRIFKEDISLLNSSALLTADPVLVLLRVCVPACFVFSPPADSFYLCTYTV